MSDNVDANEKTCHTMLLTVYSIRFFLPHWVKYIRFGHRDYALDLLIVGWALFLEFVYKIENI